MIKRRVELHIELPESGILETVTIDIAGDCVPLVDELAATIHDCATGGVLTILNVEHARLIHLDEPLTDHSQLATDNSQLPDQLPSTIDPHLGG